MGIVEVATPRGPFGTGEEVDLCEPPEYIVQDLASIY